MNIRSHSLDNQEGVLLSSGGFVANITSVLNNAQGIIKGTENSEINAQEINNNGGLIYTAKGGQVKVVKALIIKIMGESLVYLIFLFNLVSWITEAE